MQSRDQARGSSLSRQMAACPGGKVGDRREGRGASGEGGAYFVVDIFI